MEWGETVYVISMQLIKPIAGVCVVAVRATASLLKWVTDIPHVGGWRRPWVFVYVVGLLRNGLVKNTTLDKMY